MRSANARARSISPLARRQHEVASLVRHREIVDDLVVRAVPLGDEPVDQRVVEERGCELRVEDGRVVASSPNEPKVHDRLRELIALERECCSFLRFDVEERPEVIVTELRFPAGVEDATRARILEVFGP